MINILHKLLQNDKYIIKNLSEKIILYVNSEHNYPEDYIEIKKADNKYIIAEVHRDIYQIKYNTDDYTNAIVVAVILCKRLFDDIADRIMAETIRDYLKSGNEEKAKNYIIDRFGGQIFSIDSEDDKKISMIKSGDKADIKFAGTYLVEDASLSRAYVALYNYCNKLVYISDFYNDIKEEIGCKLGKDSIQKLYILGK